MSAYLTTNLDDGVLTVLLDDSEASVNTVSPAWIDEMMATFERVRDDDAVTGVIITSAKPGFMAGADIHHMLRVSAGMTVGAAYAFSQHATAMHRLIETCGKPVVAALNGFALGGGYELALACTRRIMACTAKAKVGLPEVQVGLLPGSGGTQRLPRLIGAAKAIDVLLQGKSYAPEQALALGLVDELAEPAELMSAARAWLDTKPDATRPWDRKGYSTSDSEGLLQRGNSDIYTIATGKIHGRYGKNYPAPLAILACIFEGIQVPFDKGLVVESRHFARLLTSPVARNIMRTSFVNKGLAEKGARRPAHVPKSELNKIGMLGAGMMGAGIAYVSAVAGLDVVLIDVDQAAADRGRDYSAKLLDKAVELGQRSREEADAILKRITATTDYALIHDVELVVEAVFEDTAIKAEVTRKAGAAMPASALFASNTSTLPITQLAQAFGRPRDFIGLHFFSPVDRMALVEVILGRETSPEALAAALDFVARIRKTPIVVNDRRGFYTSRVFQTFIHEGMELLREGVAPALIENAARQAGFPVGPLAVVDETTIELPLKIVRQSAAEDPTYREPGSKPVMEHMVETLKRPGRRGGGGFYDYPKNAKKHLWAGLATEFPRAAQQPAVGEVEKRLLYVQALETARCLEENVLTHPADADLGATLGWGYPMWTGGTLSLVDTVGTKQFVAECDALAAKYGERFIAPPGLRALAASNKSYDWA